MFTTTREILSQNKVVPAFNFSTCEVAKAVVEACQELGQDVILQTSMSEAEFLSLEVAAGIAEALGRWSTTSVSLHLDHAKDLKLIEKALNVGYSSVLVDGSTLNFEESVEFTNAVTSLARKDTVVEASLTEFDRAAEFVEKAKPDLLAPFTIEGGRDKTEIDKIRQACLPARQVRKFVNASLVLHNSSSKSDQEIKAAISAGVVKINWNTCLRKAWSRTLLRTFESQPDEIKPYNLLQPSVEAVKAVVREKVGLLPK